MIFRIDQSGALKAHLSGKIGRAVSDGVLSAGMRLVQVIKGELIPAEDPQPVDQKTYRDAWQCAATTGGADVFNDAPHAVVIEYGARAEKIKIGAKMIQALAEWVVRKGLVGGGPGSHQSRALEDEAQSMAWAIAKSMAGFGEHGRYPRHGIFNRDDERGGLRIAEKAGARLPAILKEEIAVEIRSALG